MVVIKKGDYICSDFASFIQGTVTGIGAIGKTGIPSYRIETPIGKTEYILKGQAKLLITPAEEAQGYQIYARHD